MSERGNAATWFVGIVWAAALLAIGYLVFEINGGRFELLDPDQVRCMIAHPGMECEQITRWEPRP